MRKKILTTYGEVTSERAGMPFIGEVIDLSYVEMLQLRLRIRQRCLDDLEFREKVVQMCAADCAFFAAVFAVFHETRKTEERRGAFHVHLDPDQADILACLQKYGGLQDIVIDKSRGIGLSYLLCVYLLWVWLFDRGGVECGLLSKDEDALDIRDRPGSLMGKLDLLFSELPAWMKFGKDGKPVLKRTSGDHKFVNLSNGNSILGFVPTDDKLRSSRLFCLGADESAFLDIEFQRWLASAHGTTPSIIYVSTHDGTSNMFYRLTQNKKADLIRITTWWFENRRCRRGLYKSVAGQIEILDRDYKFPADYPFSHEYAGLLRSPWADRAFARPEADPITVLQELYGQAVVDLKKVFQKATLDAATKTLLGPTWRGDWTLDGEFVEDYDHAAVHVFRLLERLESGRYAIGCDPSHGVPGGAYSAMSVIDVSSGEQVLSALFESCDAVKLAGLAAKLAKRLSDSIRCRIVYESTGGVGATFSNELARLKFPASLATPMHNQDKGESWLVEMSRAIRAGDLVVRDRRVFDEFQHFSYDKNGRLAEYGGRDGHGDGSIALSLAWQYVKSFIERAKQPGRYRSSPGLSEFEKEPKIQAERKRVKAWSDKFRTPLA